MSSGVKGGASRVSIPSGVKKTIDNIKEITGQNHSEDEIYAMLKECSMDPNETTQKLLLLDTFHEVKRKRDRRNENQNKEPAEKWKPGTQTRPNRAGRGNYPLRYVSHDAGGGRNSPAVKGSSASHFTVKSTSKAPIAAPQDARKSDTSSGTSLITGVSNGPSGITLQRANPTTAIPNKSEKPLMVSSSIDSVKNLSTPQVKNIQQHQILESSKNATSIPSASGSYISSSDPVLLPSQDYPPPSAVGSIHLEVGIQQSPSQMVDDIPTGNRSTSPEILAASEVGTAIEQKMPSDLKRVGKSQNSESAQAPSSGSRPSSNYNNQSQVIGSQKVGPGKEWKPKSTNPSVSQGATAASLLDVSIVSVGSHLESLTTPAAATTNEATLELQKKLEELRISERQHVILPNHLHVPKIENLGFCFGSFDASFTLDNQNGLPADKSPSLSESSENIEEPVEDLELSNEASLPDGEDTEPKYPEEPQSPSQGPDKFASGEVEVSSSITTIYNDPIIEVAPGSQPHPLVQTSSNYGFGFMPPILGGQLPSSENSEAHARDPPRLPSFVVPQSFDPTSYYAQLDGRISPFHAAGAANKYNGNAAQASQNPQELQGGAPLVRSTASPPPLATQAAGVMQSSIPASQQPHPMFRQPPGVHLPHYPPTYIPYGHYFSPYYVQPPPTIHQFLSNGAFPQQPQPGSLYPTAPGTAAKYSASQYKQGANTGSSAPTGVPGNYGQYDLSPANYTSGSAPAPVTSTSNEDIGAPHMNNVYSSGQQQNEGPSVWFPTPGRDISTLHASSFYNLPQGQLAFTPNQTGHRTFTGIFHPAAQAVAPQNVHPLLQQSQGITNPADMVGPTGNVYQQQQPQHAQLNWPSNY
ncbi:GBF-interacting protein 1-like isoform X1 [Salvia splendens]|uniref:GBF-interacting protein 1-like isoform X1 n=1 Tax=Salvia splendens TaxID=180675 RepID=UPI001C25D88E|nr:GBF-interacting protein 1-like isoform X1 [Salvia splendens]XP_041990783.1 GBF-interacting protein 1-like isoform X1 [Salvia splendens]